MRCKKDMKKGRQKLGFTIIEVALVLAITGALFAMVMSNTAIRVASRRYFDSVNDIAENLRNAYSAAINVENYRRNTEDTSFFCSITSAYENHTLVTNSSTELSDVNTDNLPGRTRCAVYGQLITLGEDGRSDIYRYDIIGLAIDNNIEPGDSIDADKTSDDILKTLLSGKTRTGAKEVATGVGANIVTIKQQGTNIATCNASLAGTYSMYSPQWGATIENRESRDLYRGAIMIVRSPLSGTIHTYFYSRDGLYDIKDTKDSVAYNDGSIEKRSYRDNPSSDESFFVQKWLRDTGSNNCNNFEKDEGYFIDKAIREGRMVKNGNMDICIGSEDLYSVGNKRRAIRIHGDGSTEAAVEVLTERDSVEVCKVI